MDKVLVNLLLLLPLISFVLAIQLPRTKAIPWVSSVFILLTFLSSLVLIPLFSEGPILEEYTWFRLGESIEFNYGFLLDRVSGSLTVVVAFVSLLVHVFSIEYMKNDPAKSRYFAFLGLFTFSMMGLLLASNLLITFIFWELVGFCSYLLIGFWWQRDSASFAAKKAFIINRIGDLGFLIGLFLLWSHFGTLSISELREVNILSHPNSLMTAIGLALFCGAVGKSAQFPLFTWLPTAMEGPTPVSAFIHAATMVAAGVYFMARVYFLLTIDTLIVMATIGAVTALMGAVAALRQSDIKKVLAYSTISQLGYMIMGLGVGAFSSAIFHLITHAFFKACLFLCAGAIIHALHEAQKMSKAHFDVQNMNNLGGLKHKLPLVYYAFALSMAGLSGLPIFSGFLSKDAILLGAVSFAQDNGMILNIVPVLGFATAFLTPLYIGREFFLVFMKKAPKQHAETYQLIQKPNILISVPLILLSALSLGLFFSTNPVDFAGSWVLNYVQFDFKSEIPGGNHLLVSLISVAITLLGFLLIYLVYISNGKRLSKLKGHFSNSFLGKLSQKAWFLDTIYDERVNNLTLRFSQNIRRFDSVVIDGAVNFIGVLNIVVAHVVAWVDRNIVDGFVDLLAFTSRLTGRWFGSIQGGNIQRYILWGLFISLAVLLFLIF